MPEGPSLYILKEELNKFIGKSIIRASGNAKIDMDILDGKKITNIRTWGKQLFIFVNGTTVRIHLLMFGTYSFDEQTRPTSRVRLYLEFLKGKVWFYTCSVKLVEDPTNIYDWKADVMSKAWDAAAAKKKLKALPGIMACDALLNQEIFSGVGNIMKNEILYRTKIHPETLLGNLPPAKLSILIKTAPEYAFDFLKWKKANTLKKHWLAHTKKTCLRCNLPIIKKYCGKTKRRTFYCSNCQVKY